MSLIKHKNDENVANIDKLLTVCSALTNLGEPVVIGCVQLSYHYLTVLLYYTMQKVENTDVYWEVYSTRIIELYSHMYFSGIHICK